MLRFLFIMLLLYFTSPGLVQIPPSSQGHRQYLIHIYPPLDLNNIHSSLDEYVHYFREQGYDVVTLDYVNWNIELLTSEREMIILKKIFQDKMNLKCHNTEEYSTVPDGYKRLSYINTFLSEFKGVEFINLNQMFGEYKMTSEGRFVYAVRISNGGVKHNVLIDALHHARELITTEILLDLVKHRVLEEYLDVYDFWIIPVLNVDGYARVFDKNRWYRKNGNGVDLNRNYDIGFLKCGGESEPDSETYKGPKAFSEVETMIIRNMIEQLNFAKVLTLHSAGRSVLYPYTECLKMPKYYRKLVEKYAKELASVANYTVSAPSADGEHESYEFKMVTSYAFLIETGIEFQPVFTEALEEVKRVTPLILRAVNKTIPIQGRVYDKRTKKPIQVFIKIKGIKWHNNEQRVSSKSNGLYHMFVDEGDYEILFFQKGYENLIVKIHFDGVRTVTRDVYLDKIDDSGL